MLLTEPRSINALARTTASLGVWNSGWPFTVAVLERPGNRPLRPPPIALLTVADGKEGWPLTPQQIVYHVSGGSKREVCRPQRLPPPGGWFNFTVTFKGNSALLDVAGCSVLGSLGRAREPLSLAVWGAVDPARIVLSGTAGFSLAPLPRSMYEPPAADAPSCEVLNDAAERLTVFTSADDAYLRSGGLDMMARGFLREAAAKLIVIGSAEAGAQETAAMQQTRGKMYKIRLKLTSLYRLLEACPPPEGACLGVFDADTVWLPHFSRPLQRLCREWEARLPGAGVLFHAESNVQPPLFAEEMGWHTRGGFYHGLNGGGFFGRWRAVRDAIAAGMQLYGVSMRGVLAARHAPQQLLPLALQPYLNDQGSWMKLFLTQRHARAAVGAPAWMSVPRLVLDENATYMQAMFAPWGARRPQKMESALERTPKGGVRNLYTGTSPVELHYNGPGRDAHGSKELSIESMAGASPPCGDDGIERQIVLLDYVRLARRSATQALKPKCSRHLT